MRKEYDFSRSEKNPYARRLKKQVTIRLDSDTLAYFKRLADEAALPYQTLINLYLRDCAAHAAAIVGSRVTARSKAMVAARTSATVKLSMRCTPRRY